MPSRIQERRGDQRIPPTPPLQSSNSQWVSYEHISYREQKPGRNRGETSTGCMGEIRHRSLNEGETHTNHISDKRYRGSRRERGIVRDTRRSTSVSYPTPPPLLLILIVGTATVLQASVSRHKLKPQTAPPNIYSLEHSNSEGKAVRR